MHRPISCSSKRDSSKGSDTYLTVADYLAQLLFDKDREPHKVPSALFGLTEFSMGLISFLRWSTFSALADPRDKGRIKCSVSSTMWLGGFAANSQANMGGCVGCCLLAMQFHTQEPTA